MKGDNYVGKGMGRRTVEGSGSGSGVGRNKERGPREWMEIMGLGEEGISMTCQRSWKGRLPGVYRGDLLRLLAERNMEQEVSISYSHVGLPLEV